MKALYVAACSLEEYGVKDCEPVKNVSDTIVYKNGEYAVRPSVEHTFLHMWKNVILTTLCGVNRPLIDALAAGRCEDTNINTRFIYDICTMHKKDASQYAKKYNFQIK